MQHDAERLTRVPAVFCDYRAVQNETVRRLRGWLAGAEFATTEAVEQRLRGLAELAAANEKPHTT